MLWRTNHYALCLIFIAGALLTIEAGFRIGRRRSRFTDPAEREHYGALQNAILVLLSLLLGFTFLMSVARFDTRKEQVIEEANAIGTTFLRSKFLPSPHREVAAALLRKYVDARIAFDRAGIDEARLNAADAEASGIQDQLWALASAVAALDPKALPTGLFIQSLNDVIDVREKRQVSLDDHVPEAVVYLLLVVWAFALALMAYGCGLTGRRRLVSNSMFAVMIALVLTVILDIDRPRRGMITVSKASIMRLRAAVDEGADR
jgi:hypothetical protein